jgi:lysophospholipase L1-like esterase
MKKRTPALPRISALALAAGAFFALGLTPGPIGNSSVRAQAVAATPAPLPAKAPFASEINAFQAADQKQMPPSGAVLFIGSSSVRFWTTLAQDFLEIPVINRGFGGSFIQDSTAYADRIAIPYKPKMIVLFAGTNDLDYGHKSPEQVLQDYKDFVVKIHAALPDTRIVFISISPTVARWKNEANILETNHLIQEFTFQTNSPTEKLDFIDTHSQLLTPDGQPQPRLLRADGLHFNSDGYHVFTAIVKPRILALADLSGVTRLNTVQTP